jgi:hypothetical protein
MIFEFRGGDELIVVDGIARVEHLVVEQLSRELKSWTPGRYSNFFQRRFGSIIIQRPNNV